MRIISIIFLLLPLMAFASYNHKAHLTCYSQGKVIYSGQVKGLIHEDGMFAFIDNSHKGVVFISGDCVAKVTE